MQDFEAEFSSAVNLTLFFAEQEEKDGNVEKSDKRD